MKLLRTVLLGALAFGQETGGEVDELDERGIRSNEQAILLDQNSEDFDDRAELLFEQLFPSLVNDPDFMMNAQEVIDQDAEICELGRDPIHNKKVNCEYQTKSGKLAPKTRYQTPARKFRHLKILVLWLQKQPRFGNYCYYGCYCLPEGSHDLGGGGYGEPVDMIDRTCKTFNQCYECAKLGNGQIQDTGPECQGAHTKYRFQLITNTDNGEKSIRCRNPENTCARHICECDKKMAESLSKWEDTWDVKYHTGRNNGEWKYNDNCKKKGLGRYGKPTTCCGDAFPDMKPRQEGKVCCAHIPWDPNTTDKQCCPNGKLKQTC